MYRLLCLVSLLSLVPTLTACEDVQSCDGNRGASGGPVLERFSLTAADAPLDLVGVAVDPMTGSRFVLDRSNRLYDVSSEGALALRIDLAETWGEEPLQDVCAVSENEVFTVAPGFGLKVNLTTQEAQSHFCLEPEMEPGDVNPWIELRHETHAIACDLDASLIFGQPQTVPRDEEDGAPVQSEVSLYDLPSGQDLVWYPLPSELFLAGGMALVDLGRSAPFDPDAYFDKTLLLGRDSMISSYDAGTGVLEPEIDLAPYGVTRIEGLALDAERDALLIVDGEDSELVILDLQVLRHSP